MFELGTEKRRITVHHICSAFEIQEIAKEDKYATDEMGEESVDSG